MTPLGRALKVVAEAKASLASVEDHLERIDRCAGYAEIDVETALALAWVEQLSRELREVRSLCIVEMPESPVVTDFRRICK